VARDCLRWLKMYSVKMRSLPIFNDQNRVTGWRDFTGVEIQGDYDVDVFVGSTTAPNHNEKVQSIGFFLQSLNPVLQMLVPATQAGINLLPLVKQLLKALPDIRDVDEILAGLTPQPPMVPMQEPVPANLPVPGMDFPPVDERMMAPVPGDEQLLAALQAATY
jgi:hypothetical protein